MRASLLCLVPAALAAGCQLFSTPYERAAAELRSTRGHAAAGMVTFEQIGARVRVQAAVSGLRPGDVMTLSKGPASIVGRSVVVHAQPDDYRTQPAGNTGARIACGVIRKVAAN